MDEENAMWIKECNLTNKQANLGLKVEHQELQLDQCPIFLYIKTIDRQSYKKKWKQTIRGKIICQTLASHREWDKGKI